MDPKKLAKNSKIIGTIKGHTINITYPHAYDFYNLFIESRFVARTRDAESAIAKAIDVLKRVRQKTRRKRAKS